MKKGNIVPAHKKSDKQNIKNRRTVSFLPICGKIFERLIFNEIFRFLSLIIFFTKPGDSCINQLLSITHEIYKLFDDRLKVRGAFLDIFNAFDRVWHEGLISKLKRYGISGDLFQVLSAFLSSSMERVVFNAKNSSWTNVHAGVLQGSIQGLLLILIYINDLADDLFSNVKLFPDYTALFSVVHDVNASARELNNDLKKIN